MTWAPPNVSVPLCTGYIAYFRCKYDIRCSIWVCMNGSVSNTFESLFNVTQFLKINRHRSLFSILWIFFVYGYFLQLIIKHHSGVARRQGSKVSRRWELSPLLPLLLSASCPDDLEMMCSRRMLWQHAVAHLTACAALWEKWRCEARKMRDG